MPGSPLRPDGSETAPRRTVRYEAVTMTSESSADSAGTPVVDLKMIDQLLELADGEDTILREIIEVFLEDAPARIEQMRATLSADDAQSLHEAAHTLKGSCSNLGLAVLQEACAELDKRARAGALDEAAVCLAAVEAAFAEGREALLEMLEEGA